MPLDQLLKDEEFPETERLLRSISLKHLNQVADRKGMEPSLCLKDIQDVLIVVSVNECR
jgi:hypothetical protein